VLHSVLFFVAAAMGASGGAASDPPTSRAAASGREAAIEAVVAIEVRLAEGDRDRIVALGTGIVLEDGRTVVTCEHVVASFGEVTIRASRREVAAIVVSRNSREDLALLRLARWEERLPGARLDPAFESSSRDAATGAPATVVSFPRGGEKRVTEGRITALHRQLAGEGITYQFDDLLELDISIDRGSSGGALLGSGGDLIGLMNARYTSGASSYAIPADRIVAFRRDVDRFGERQSAWLGFRLCPEKGDARRIGSVVDRVFSRGPAAIAGLRRGDHLVALDGRPTDHGGFVRHEQLAERDRPLRIDVRRGGGGLLTLSVVPRAWPSDLGTRLLAEAWGVTTQRRRFGGSIYEIVGVAKGSAAARAGLPIGVALRRVDGIPVESREALAVLLFRALHRRTLWLDIGSNEGGSRIELSRSCPDGRP
jgi:S1-C subfamily serine protease